MRETFHQKNPQVAITQFVIMSQDCNLKELLLMQGDRLILKLNTSLLKKKVFFSRQFGSIMKIFRTEIRKCAPVKCATQQHLLIL